MSGDSPPGLAPPRRRPDVQWEELDGEVVVFDSADKVVHLLNQSAAAVWCRLDGTVTVAQVASGLAREHAADEAMVMRDVDAVLTDLEIRGLLAGSIAEDGGAGYTPAREDPPPTLVPARREDQPPDVGGLIHLGTYRALGFSFSVHIGDTVDSDLDEMMSPLEGSEPGDAGSIVPITVTGVGRSAWPCQVWIGNESIGTMDSPARLDEHLLWQIVHRAVASESSRPVLHAAAAAIGDRGVLLPGPSGAGKSTLVAALVQGGLAYLGDEAIGVDLVHRVLMPLPKPIKLDVGCLDLFSSHWAEQAGGSSGRSSLHVPPERIREGSVSGPVSVCALVLPGHEPSESPRLEPISSSSALAALIGQVFAPGLSPSDFPALVELVRAVPAYRVVGDDLSTTCRLIRDLLADRGP